MTTKNSGYIDQREKIASIPRLRMSHVVRFLRQSGRSEVCPFCSYKGSWNFHVEMPEHDPEPQEDSLMSLYIFPTAQPEFPHECVAVTCPNCAHFSLLDVNAIKLHVWGQAQAQAHTNG